MFNFLGTPAPGPRVRGNDARNRGPPSEIMARRDVRVERWRFAMLFREDPSSCGAQAHEEFPGVKGKFGRGRRSSQLRPFFASPWGHLLGT